MAWQWLVPHLLFADPWNHPPSGVASSITHLLMCIHTLVCGQSHRCERESVHSAIRKIPAGAKRAQLSSNYFSFICEHQMYLSKAVINCVATCRWQILFEFLNKNGSVKKKRIKDTSSDSLQCLLPLLKEGAFAIFVYFLLTNIQSGDTF